MNENPNTAAPVTVEAVTESIRESLVGIWASFIDHLPYLATGLAVLVGTWIVSMAIRRVLRRGMSRWQTRASLKELLLRLVSIAVWSLGSLLAAMVVFPGLTPAKALGALGLASVAVGLAFKDIFENFFAGILILWRFPFENGDFIECGDISGRVEKVTIRMTEIRRTTGELVVVPNAFLFKNPVEVLTNRSSRRVTLLTGIAYDEDVTTAVGVIENAVETCASVEKQQPVEVFPQAFGASSVDIEVAWWTEATPLGQRRSRGEVITAIKKALDDAGIEIPFPYRTLTFQSPIDVREVGAATD